jgi:hypothetical protein
LRLTKLSPILVSLVMAACQSAPPPRPALSGPPQGPRLARGVDVPTDAGDVLAELKASGLDFVARYYREPDSRWPALSANEARQLSATGLKIVAVWESHSHKAAHFSYASGYGDALNAYGQARAIGQPPGSAVYFAVDYNAPSRAFGAVGDYFRGVADAFAAAGGGSSDYLVGVYGSGAVCDALRGAGLARYCWLSNAIAWHGTIGYQAWNIRQVGRLPVLSFNHDANEARDEYGAFRLAANGPGATTYRGCGAAGARPASDRRERPSADLGEPPLAFASSPGQARPRRLPRDQGTRSLQSHFPGHPRAFAGTTNFPWDCGATLTSQASAIAAIFSDSRMPFQATSMIV